MRRRLTPRQIAEREREGGFAAVAKREGVTVEHVKAVMRARLQYRLARIDRIRSRNRRTNPRLVYRHRRMKTDQHHLLSGEGRFHELLKIAGLDTHTFANLVGRNRKTVNSWQGFPLEQWPVLFLELLIHNKNMAQKLQQHGWNPDQFKAGHLPPAPTGRYPRTAEQGRELIRAAEKGVREGTP